MSDFFLIFETVVNAVSTAIYLWAVKLYVWWSLNVLWQELVNHSWYDNLTQKEGDIKDRKQPFCFSYHARILSRLWNKFALVFWKKFPKQT